MVCTNLCPFDNTNCMCQFCENPCNNGLNCSDCRFHNKIMHTIYLCTGFEGEEHVVYHRLYDVANITVISNKNTVGVFDMESQVKTELTKAEARKE